MSLTYEQALAFWNGRINYEQSPAHPDDLNLDRMASLLRNNAQALSTAATCREAEVPSVGRQRLQGRSPAASAAAVVSKNIVFLRSGSRDVQPGRQ